MVGLGTFSGRGTSAEPVFQNQEQHVTGCQAESQQDLETEAEQRSIVDAKASGIKCSVLLLPAIPRVMFLVQELSC